MRTNKIKFLKIIIILMSMLFVFAAVYILPIYSNTMAESYPEYAHLKHPLLISIILTLFPLLFSFFQAFQLLNYIERDNIFNVHSIDALKNIRSCAVLIGMIYIIGMIFIFFENALHPSLFLLGFFICLMTIVIGLFTSILREILTYAISYKHENDLTI